MRLRTWPSLGVVALVALAVPVALYFHAGTVHPDCAGNTTCEMSRRDADIAGEFAVGLTCYHATSATLAVIAKAPCQAYATDGTYIEWTQDVGWTYAGGDGTYYYGVHKSPGATVSGWQAVAGTPYRWIKSATLPVVADPGFVLIGQATVVGPAVTAATELVPRRFQPRAPLPTVPLGMTRWLGSCPVAGRWPLWVADSVTSGVVSFATACTLLPEWWGATGDGVTLDGLALWGMVSGINAAVPAQLPVTVLFGPGRTYLITGGPNQDTPPARREGLQFITKSHVELVAYHSELKVPASYPWIYTEHASDPRTEVQGLVLVGANIVLRGGLYNGNLRARNITRGTVGVSADGAEFGIRVGKASGNLVIEDVIVREWGTDNLYFYTGNEGALIRASVFERSRRNNVTIALFVPEAMGLVAQPIIFEGCEFRHAGQYPDVPTDVVPQQWTRPADGVHIEGSPEGISVSLHLLNNIFVSNRNANVTLGAPGYRHVIKNNLFRGVYDPGEVGGDGLPTYEGGIVAPDEDLGGHVIQGNIFEDVGLVVGSQADDEPWVVTGNIFRGTVPPINMIPENPALPPSGWVVTGNSAPNVTRDGQTHIEGPNHKVGYNAYKNPPEYVYNSPSVAAGATLALDLAPILQGTATYLVVAKGNATSSGGEYDVTAIYLLTWNDTTLEGAWNLLPPNAAWTAATTDPDLTVSLMAGTCGRKITRVGAVITFDNTACGVASRFGLIAYAIGRGDWGT